MKVEVDDNRNIRIVFEGELAGLCTLGGSMWSMPDGGKTKRYRELCDRLVPIIIDALANYQEEPE